MTDDEIVAAASQNELGDVASQAVSWHPNSWRTKVHERVPNEAVGAALDELISAVVGPGKDGGDVMSREQVVDRFQRGSHLEAFLAAIIWGCGTGARNRGRMLRIFSDNEPLVERTNAFVDASRAAGPSEAWDIVTSPLHRLKWLGVAFGTKVVYFAALAERGPRGSLPLIADANVVKALGLPVTTDRGQYIGYCERADRLSQHLSGERRRPDQIEYALFRTGR